MKVKICMFLLVVCCRSLAALDCYRCDPSRLKAECDDPYVPAFRGSTRRCKDACAVVKIATANTTRGCSEDLAPLCSNSSSCVTCTKDWCNGPEPRCFDLHGEQISCSTDWTVIGWMFAIMAVVLVAMLVVALVMHCRRRMQLRWVRQYDHM